MLGLTDKRNYADIADAIRNLTKTDGWMLPSEMAQAIREFHPIARPVAVETQHAAMRRNAADATSQPKSSPRVVASSLRLPVGRFSTSASEE